MISASFSCSCGQLYIVAISNLSAALLCNPKKYRISRKLTQPPEMSLVSASSHGRDQASPPLAGLSPESTQLPLMASVLHSPSSQEDSSSPTPHPSPAVTVSVSLGPYSSSASPPAPPLLKSVSNHSKPTAMTGTLCLVCGDVAPKDTVFRTHYGVICCEACKCFFRRTVQMNRDYKCRYGNNCSVGRSTVNMKQVCQACRFGQCVKAGMKIECKWLGFVWY